MNILELLFRREAKDRPPDDNPPVTQEPQAPPNSTIVLEEIKHAEITGHPETVFTHREHVYVGEDGRKCKITVQNNLQSAGCGHNLTSPNDVGFISHVSKLPVCRICEQEYYRLREQTRHEKCICRHLVAPHELTYLEGNGFVCDECKKKAKAITPKKVGKWIWSSVIKPLFLEEPKPMEGIDYDFPKLPPPGNQPPFSNDQGTRP